VRFVPVEKDWKPNWYCRGLSESDHRAAEIIKLVINSYPKRGEILKCPRNGGRLMIIFIDAEEDAHDSDKINCELCMKALAWNKTLNCKFSPARKYWDVGVREKDEILRDESSIDQVALQGCTKSRTAVNILLLFELTKLVDEFKKLMDDNWEE
jgi:hypothetical protein